jgi:putative FmdB family regulatory protein
MPTYEYRCGKCLKKIEIFQKITDQPVKDCPECGEAALVRGPGGGIGLSFSGTGWYKTDYAPNRPKENEPTSKSECCPCGKNVNSCSSNT